MRLEFRVYGRPVPKGSVVAFVPHGKAGWATRPDGSPIVVKHDESSGNSWAHDITVTALTVMRESGLRQTPHGVPMLVSVTFLVPRAISHYGTGRHRDTLKPSAPAYPSLRPDIDKWVRQVLDALSGVVYKDDGQVVTLIGSKVYIDKAMPYQTSITVSELDPLSPLELVP